MSLSFIALAGTPLIGTIDTPGPELKTKQNNNTAVS